MVDSRTVGRRLRELRGYMPRRLLADKCGVSRQTVSVWESGARSPSDKHKMAIAEFYGRTVQELFYDE